MLLKDRINEAVAAIQPHLNASPRVALILGSGLGRLAEYIENRVSFDYGDIPHFKQSGAPGHVGRLVCGELSGQQVVCMQGRLHAYEGNSATEIVFPLQVMHALGARTLVVTNAAGAVNTGFEVGDIMLIADHINLTGSHPLTLGDEQDSHEFTDLTYA
jgi:purine-nucleoside phosphorylase